MAKQAELVEFMNDSLKFKKERKKGCYDFIFV
jgi:hypothetical protein